ncbi:MAG: hypothetical protein K2H53_04245 [Clostridia bacterium]|nr:hypothetical protein [Clostridia bacterium]
MAILIDKRIQKFVEGCQYKDGKVISIHLKDIDETFWFDSEVAAQDFLNKQAIERVGDPELRTDSFDYTDEEGVLRRYLLGGVNRKGEILSYLEEVVNELTEAQLYEEYNYLMDQEHGKDTELLMDIMKCNGLDVEEKNGKYLVFDK